MKIFTSVSGYSQATYICAALTSFFLLIVIVYFGRSEGHEFGHWLTLLPAFIIPFVFMRDSFFRVFAALVYVLLLGSLPFYLLGIDGDLESWMFGNVYKGLTVFLVLVCEYLISKFEQKSGNDTSFSSYLHVGILLLFLIGVILMVKS